MSCVIFLALLILIHSTPILLTVLLIYLSFFFFFYFRFSFQAGKCLWVYMNRGYQVYVSGLNIKSFLEITQTCFEGWPKSSSICLFYLLFPFYFTLNCESADCTSAQHICPRHSRCIGSKYPDIETELKLALAGIILLQMISL